jgi:hypothetical protein
MKRARSDEAFRSVPIRHEGCRSVCNILDFAASSASNTRRDKLFFDIQVRS